MAQAVVDLPDQPDPALDSLAKTDEMLSEMVGNDIDRLLADAAAPPEPAHAEVAPPQANDEATLTAQLDDLFNELQNDTPPVAASKVETAAVETAAEAEVTPTPEPTAEPAAKVETAAAPAPAAEKEEFTAESAERAALLQATSGETEAPATVAAPAAAPAAEAKISASADPVHETAPDGPERSALLAAAGFDTNPNAPGIEVGPMTKAGLEQAELNDENAPLPFYLRPLEWINLPLRSCPAAIRQSLGQAAIVTLVFAIAVLGYVMTHPRH